MLTALPIEDLQPGHFVKRVLEQTGNKVVSTEGLVKTKAAITELKNKGIQIVEVDLDRSDIQPQQAAQANSEPETKAPENEATTDALLEANSLYEEAVSIQEGLLQKLKDSSANDLTPLEGLSQNLIQSVFDNPGAMSCLTMIKSTDKYLLEHSLNCSVLMTLFATHLGYEDETLEELSLGALLMDIGMAWVSPDLRLSQKALTEDDWVIIRNHVEHGIDIIERSGDMPLVTRTIVEQHHERLDGSGYPNALEGEEVSPFARMAAIVDTYDAMVSDRPHQESLPAAVALKRLAGTPGLDSELVRQFIACIGIYPVGSLVKLKSGRLGLVAKTNEHDLTNPVVMTFYSVTGHHHSDIKRIDLSKVDDEVDASVTPSEFNINLPRFFREVFISRS